MVVGHVAPEAYVGGNDRADPRRRLDHHRRAQAAAAAQRRRRRDRAPARRLEAAGAALHAGRARQVRQARLDRQQGRDHGREAVLSGGPRVRDRFAVARALGPERQISRLAPERPRAPPTNGMAPTLPSRHAGGMSTPPCALLAGEEERRSRTARCAAGGVHAFVFGGARGRPGAQPTTHRSECTCDRRSRSRTRATVYRPRATCWLPAHP